MSAVPVPAPDWNALAAKAWVRRTAVALLLAVVNVVVYREAMNRFFNADQLHYFAERGNDLRFSGGLALWDYNAARQFWKGDELLFRPLSGVVLAAETAAFGAQYRGWNWTNLLLHIGVAFILFEVLWSIRPSAFAVAGAAVFSLVTANFELVVWGHLSFYLIGYGFLLLALQAAWRLCREDSERGPMLQYILAMAGAMACHEIAVVAGVILPACVAVSNPRRRRALPLALMLLPLALYAGLYVGHVMRCERWRWTDPAVAPVAVEPFPIRVVLTLGSWGLRALNPWYADFDFHNFIRFDWSKRPAGAGQVPGFVVSAGLLAALGWGLRRCPSRDRVRTTWPFVASLLILLAAYSAMNSVGRPYAGGVTYYVYFFALIAAPLLYVLVDPGKAEGRERRLALAMLLVLGAAQAWRTREASREMAAVNAPVSAFFDDLERFVAAHRGEPGFAFAVQAPDSVDPSFSVIKGYPDHPEDGVATVSAFMYPAYLDTRIFRTGPDPLRHRYLLGWSPR